MEGWRLLVSLTSNVGYQLCIYICITFAGWWVRMVMWWNQGEKKIRFLLECDTPNDSLYVHLCLILPYLQFVNQWIHSLCILFCFELFSWCRINQSLHFYSFFYYIFAINLNTFWHKNVITSSFFLFKNHGGCKLLHLVIKASWLCDSFYLLFFLTAPALITLLANHHCSSVL